MKEKSFISILFQYLNHYKYAIFFLLFFTLLYTFFSFLYNYDMHAILYIFLITYFLVFIIGIIHFQFYYHKHRKLRQLEQHITISLHDLPNTSSLIEIDYQELLHTLLLRYQSTLTEHSKYQEELLDYYSLWVHQIKTPIAAMKLLLETDTQDNSEKLLELQRIEQYVEMALQYLRLESMSSDLVIKPYDLDSLLHDVIRKEASFFINKKIRLQYAPINTSVITDAKWFKLVIEQVLTNSLKYTQNGSISIYLEDKKLIIEDTGMGIQEEDLPRVFERGFTGYNGRMNKKSTGIGLYLCKKIMDNLHHEISISSKLGKGTKVIIDLEQTNMIFE